jgi:hypothetical protein
VTHHDPTDADADASFERLLLRSASADPLPHAATREAWARFASASSGVALVASAAPGPAGLLHAARRSSLTWLAVGALGGSAITAAWLGTRPTTTVAGVAPSSQVTAIAPPSPPSAQGSVVPALEPDTQERLESGQRRPLARKQPQTASAPAAKQQPIAASDASSLAAEVSALDAVQRAITARDFPRALRLVAEYHRAFPHGQLAPDAEALAIEALETSGNRSELATRAARFLRQYPNDPHAGRIAAFVEP